jgi:hypothetical protein
MSSAQRTGREGFEFVRVMCAAVAGWPLGAGFLFARGYRSKGALRAARLAWSTALLSALVYMLSVLLFLANTTEGSHRGVLRAAISAFLALAMLNALVFARHQRTLGGRRRLPLARGWSAQALAVVVNAVVMFGATIVSAELAARWPW